MRSPGVLRRSFSFWTIFTPSRPNGVGHDRLYHRACAVPNAPDAALPDRPTPPTFPLARPKPVVDIRAEQLRFTRDEISFFLTEVMGLKPSRDDIAAMETRTEGWIAGLQLAAISMQGFNDVHDFVSAFTGSHYYIMDYLTEEVLKRLPERLSLFLLQTSILGRMCGPLCEAVVEPGTKEHPVQRLEQSAKAVSELI